MTAMKNRTILSLAIVTVVICAFVVCCNLTHEYEAKCVFAYSDRDIQTNSVGGVVQPEARMGAYADFRIIANDDFSRLLSGRGKECPLVDCCKRDLAKSSAEADLIAKAFLTLTCRVSGGEVGVVEFSLKSSSEEIARKVLAFAIAAFRQQMADDNLSRDQKALAHIRSRILYGREKGEDVSALEKQCEQARANLEKRHVRITMLEELSVSR